MLGLRRRRAPAPAPAPPVVEAELPEFEVILESADGAMHIESRGGVWWHKAPVPPRSHKCVVWTRSWFNYTELAERCACGAINQGRPMVWIWRNSRTS